MIILLSFGVGPSNQTVGIHLDEICTKIVMVIKPEIQKENNTGKCQHMHINKTIYPFRHSDTPQKLLKLVA